VQRCGLSLIKGFQSRYIIQVGNLWLPSIPSSRDAPDCSPHPLYMKRILLATALSALTLAAWGQTLPTQLLTTTNDGAGTDVQSLITSTGSFANVNFDQVATAPFFEGTGAPITLTYKWAAAGLAGKHRLGYVNLAEGPGVNWVLGNVAQDGNQITSWTGSWNGLAALVLDNGDGELFSSNLLENTDSALPASAEASLVGFDRRQHLATIRDPGTGELFLAWEDLKDMTPVIDGGLLDYNDYGLTLSGSVAPVPEPGLLLAVGAGAALFAARRRRNQVG
jgi:hypothetical protein